MKASDYIIEYLIDKGITNIFGYPGGMVTHLMDSLSKYHEKIKTHLMYHEQGASFAACGYAQSSDEIGVAFATSGPGATNLVTGICNAYFDSIPVLFITGQVNSFEGKDKLQIRQRGFQETDIVSMVSNVTKYAAYISDPDKIKWYLDKAFYEVSCGRKGPVLLDIPMNIMSADVNPGVLHKYQQDHLTNDSHQLERYIDLIMEELKHRNNPVLLIGQGVKSSKSVPLVRRFVAQYKIPTVSSMLAVDVIDDKNQNYGFIGAYGNRTANFIVAKCDLMISLGARLDIRQVGKLRSQFAPSAMIIRIDIDEGELSYRVHNDDLPIQADLTNIISGLLDRKDVKDYSEWNQICAYIRKKLNGVDDKAPNYLIRNISKYIPDNAVITTDVGQNQVWISQSFDIKTNQKLLFSGGHGAMGYSLPAAIGCSIATGKTVYSFNGDGGIQMNIQELQTIVRENLPIKIIILNNSALGMIRHFQEMYFDKNYFMTVKENGYSNPDFEKIAYAYDIPYQKIDGLSKKIVNPFKADGVEMIEVVFNIDTYVFPKLEYGKPNQDQEPLLERELYNLLMDNEEIKMQIQEIQMNQSGK